MSITFNILYTAILLLSPNISLQVTPPFPSVCTPSAPEHSAHLYCFVLIPVSPYTLLTTLTAFYIRLLRQQKFLSCLTAGALFRCSVTPYHYICYFSKITCLFIPPHTLTKLLPCYSISMQFHCSPAPHPLLCRNQPTADVNNFCSSLPTNCHPEKMTLFYISISYLWNLAYFLYKAGKLFGVFCDCLHEGLHDRAAQQIANIWMQGSRTKWCCEGTLQVLLVITVGFNAACGGLGKQTE